MDLSAARRRGLRASTGGGDASRGAAMAGGKKARAKLKSGRLENRMRAGNGSDPTSQGDVGSSRPPRSQSPTSLKRVISYEDALFFKTAFARALRNENGYIQGRLKEEFPLMVYSIMEGTPNPGDARKNKNIRGPETEFFLDEKTSPFSSEHRTLFSALKEETQILLLSLGSRIGWVRGGAFRKMPVDLMSCLWNESPEPETVRALERHLDASFPSHSPSTPTLPSRAAAADDDDASGPPSLAPSDGDDDDETRDSRLPPSDAPFYKKNGETVTDDDDDDDDDDDSSAPPSLATSSGSDDEEEDRARFEEPEESEETENATRRTNPRTNSERAAPEVAEEPSSSSASSSQPPSLASSPDSSRAASPRARARAPANGCPGTRETREPALTSRPPRRSTAWSIRARRRELKKKSAAAKPKKSRALFARRRETLVS